MKKRPTSGDEPSGGAGADETGRELAELRIELERARRDASTRVKVEAIAAALIGELDLDPIADLGGRWATATLGRPCTVVFERPEATALPLGSTADTAWLSVDGPELGPDDRNALDAVLTLIGRAIDAARRVGVQHAAMRMLERSLLPDALLPVTGLQIASRYVPAKGTNDVGGDFYDAVRTGEGVTLIVGDVQGKGVAAATLTSMARHTLRAGALAGRPPDALLRDVNTALLYEHEEQLAGGSDHILRFVTAAVARVEPRPSEPGSFDVTVARAGQPPPLIVRGDGRFESLEPRGVLLGVCEDPAFEATTSALHVGDALVLYTDGVIEQRGGGLKAMSEQHLGMMIRNRRGIADAEAIAQLIEDTVHLIADENIRDDVAVLVACPTR